MRVIGGNSPGENRLISFLLFEKKYTQELIELGYNDAMRVREDLVRFVSGDPVSRLIAPARVEDDLCKFDNMRS